MGGNYSVKPIYSRQTNYRQVKWLKLPRYASFIRIKVAQAIHRRPEQKQKLPLTTLVKRQIISGTGSNENIHFAHFFFSWKMVSASSFKIEDYFYNWSSKSFLVSSFWLSFGMSGRIRCFPLACLVVFLSQPADEELPKTRSTGILWWSLKKCYLFFVSGKSVLSSVVEG